MKKYIVEIAESMFDELHNAIGDFVEAESEEEAEELAKAWMLENGMEEEEIEGYIFQITEYHQ